MCVCVCVCDKTNRFHSKVHTDTVLCSKVGSEAMLIPYQSVNPPVMVLIEALQAGTIPGIRLYFSQEEFLPLLM